MPLYTLLTNQRLRKSPKDFNYEITLIANIKPESTYADWEDYVAQMPSKNTVEDLLALIQPSVNMVANKNEG